MTNRPTVLDPVSNRETWQEAYQFTDHETGETIDLIDDDENALIDAATIMVRDQTTRSQVLSGTLADGTIVLMAEGVLQWEFSESQMSALCAKTYDVGAVLEKDGQTVQFLIGFLPVIDGVVT